MSLFQLYFETGLDHILDMAGLDHLAFIILLCAIYTIKDWSKVLILVTAFTIGHSVTLALATLKIISVNAAWIEFLIPLTILLTAISNLIKGEQRSGRKIQLNYYLLLLLITQHA